jgi:hypothetical protein
MYIVLRQLQHKQPHACGSTRGYRRSSAPGQNMSCFVSEMSIREILPDLGSQSTLLVRPVPPPDTTYRSPRQKSFSVYEDHASTCSGTACLAQQLQAPGG